MKNSIVRTATGLVAVGSFLALSGTVLADVNAGPPNLDATNAFPITLEPIKVAKVLGRTADGKFILGEWQPYVSGVGLGPSYPPILYDNWGGDTANPGVCSGDPTVISPSNGPLSGGYGTACDFSEGGFNCTGACSEPPCAPGLRWFQGTSAVWSSFIHQMTGVAPGTSGIAEYIKNGWYQAYGGGGVDGCGEITDDTVIVVSIYNSTIGDQIGTDFLDNTELGDNFKDGVALGYGSIAAGGWYNGTADLRLSGDPTLYLGDVDPLVAGDAIEVTYAATDPLDPNSLVRRQYGQSMVWGPQDTSQQGETGIVYYNDGSFDFTLGVPFCTNVPDGQYTQPNGGADPSTDDDFWDGTGLCPDPLAGMIGLYGPPSEGTGVCPDTGTILAGAQFDPGFADVCDSDDARWGIQSTTFAAVFSPAPIQLEFAGNVNPLGGTNLTLTVEAQPNLGGGSAFITLRMFNWTTGTYQQVPFINQPDGTDVVYTMTRPAADYVDTNGAVLAQVTCAKTLPGPVRLLVDQVVWNVE